MGKVVFDLCGETGQASTPNIRRSSPVPVRVSLPALREPLNPESSDAVSGISRAAADRQTRFSEQGLLQASIGRKVRDMRRHHDVNGARLAEAAGISVGMLSRIENGTISPSLGTLEALAGALGLPITSLLRQHSEARKAIFVRAEEARAIQGAARHNEVRPRQPVVHRAASADGTTVETRLVEFTTPTSEFPRVRRDGTHFLYVLEGELIYRNEKNRYRMRAGDSLSLGANVRHGLADLLTLPVRLLCVRSFRTA